MGAFIGHAVPGIFFLLFGLWYTMQTFRRYFRAVSRKIPFTASISYSGTDFDAEHFPMDSAVKLACSITGFFIELGSGLSQLESGFPMRDMQHMTMYFFFGISGVIDILTYKKCFLPNGTDFVSMTMALIIELLLFKFHIHGRSPLDVRVHQLLVLAIGMNAAAVISVAFYRTELVAAVGCNWAMLVHGTWFIQLGFILYNPLPNAQKWSDDDEVQLSLTVYYFVLHCLVVFVFMSIMCLIFGYAYKGRRNTFSRNKIPAEDQMDLESE